MQKALITAAALAALVSTALAAIQIAMADDRLACLPPAVVQALS
jgi:hypothetical protein